MIASEELMLRKTFRLLPVLALIVFCGSCSGFFVSPKFRFKRSPSALPQSSSELAPLRPIALLRSGGHLDHRQRYSGHRHHRHLDQRQHLPSLPSVAPASSRRAPPSATPPSPQPAAEWPAIPVRSCSTSEPLPPPSAWKAKPAPPPLPRAQPFRPLQPPAFPATQPFLPAVPSPRTLLGPAATPPAPLPP